MPRHRPTTRARAPCHRRRPWRRSRLPSSQHDANWKLQRFGGLGRPAVTAFGDAHVQMVRRRRAVGKLPAIRVSSRAMRNSRERRRARPRVRRVCRDAASHHDLASPRREPVGRLGRDPSTSGSARRSPASRSRYATAPCCSAARLRATSRRTCSSSDPKTGTVRALATVADLLGAPPPSSSAMPSRRGASASERRPAASSRSACPTTARR